MPDTLAKSIRLRPELWARVEEEARRQKRSANNLIDVALDEWLDDQQYAREWKASDRQRES